MKKTLAVLLACCLLAAAPFAFASCDGDGGATSGGGLPVLEVGDSWVWHYTVQGADATLTEEVIGEERVEGRDCYVIDMSFDPPLSFPQAEGVSTITSMTYWADKTTVIYEVKQEMAGDYEGEPFTLTNVYSYGSWESIFPLELGKEVETEQTIIQYMGDTQIGEPVVSPLRYGVDSREEVTVAAGTFSCWKLVIYDGEGSINQIAWWSEEAKTIVKTTDNAGNITMELISY